MSGNTSPLTLARLVRTAGLVLGSALVVMTTPNGRAAQDVRLVRYIGGNAADSITAMVAGSNGHLIVGGETRSYDFTVSESAAQVRHAGSSDGFVAVIEPDSGALVAATLLGGPGPDAVTTLSLGPDGSIYAAGRTGSATLAGAAPAHRVGTGGGGDGFLVRLTPDLSRVAYLVGVGGDAWDEVTAVTSDGAGHTWVAGSTRSNSDTLPLGATAGHSAGGGDQLTLDGYVLRISSTGDVLAAERLPDLPLAAMTWSPDIGIVVAGGGEGGAAFVAALSGDGHIVRQSVIGGSGVDRAAGIAPSPTGGIALVGTTTSPDLPATAGAHSQVLAGQNDGFVAVLDSRLQIEWLTYLGGEGYDSARAVSAGVEGLAVSGLTVSRDFLGEGTGTDADAFAAVFDWSGGGLFGARYGGAHPDEALAVVLANGLVYGAGTTGSTEPVAGNPGGDESGFVAEWARGAGPLPPARPAVVLVHGWRGLSSDQSSCTDGITRHPAGNTLPSGEAGSLGDWLTADGFDVWYAHLDSGPDYTSSLMTNTACLARQLASLATERPSAPPFKLVAHSMGGLVARAYVEDDRLYQQDVDLVVTIGTPHAGVPVDLELALSGFLGLSAQLDCRRQVALCELTSAGIVGFNRRYPARRVGVDYRLVSGDIRVGDSTWLGRAFSAWIPGPDDGLVPQSSGLALAGTRASMPTDEAHGGELAGHALADRTYFAPPPGRAATTTYTDCLLPVLRGAAGCGLAPAAEGAAMSTNANQSPITRTPVITGALGAGAPLTLPFRLAAGDSATVVGSWSGDPVALSVAGPHGVVAQRGAVSSGPGPGRAGDTVSFTATLGGDYTALLASTGSASGALAAVVDGEARLEVVVDRPWYPTGAMARITATVTGDPDAVRATLQGADGRVVPAGMALGEEGVWTGDVHVGTEPGPALVTIQALWSGVIGLESVAGLLVAPAGVELTGRILDEPIAWADAGHRYDHLAVHVGIVAAEPGVVGLSAVLEASPGANRERAIAYAGTTVEVPGGPMTVTLRFPGGAIRAAGHDGPFLVADLLLEDLRLSAVPAAELLSVHVTAPYRAADFGPLQRLFLPAALRPLEVSPARARGW